MAQEITSLAQFNTLKAKPLLIVDFYATWCGPCKAISPVFERLAANNKNSNVIFAKCDVDRAQDVAGACGISAMPTFQFYGKSTKVDEVRGADVMQLQTKIAHHSGKVSASSATSQSTGTTLGGGANSSLKTSPPVSSSTPGSLRTLIDLDKSKLLNATGRANVKQVITPGFAGAEVVSASGSSQLLLHLVFTAKVNPTKVKIVLPSGDGSNGKRGGAPSKVHVGSNLQGEPKDLLALGLCENVQSIAVFQDEYVAGTATLPLKASRFQASQALTFLIERSSAENSAGEPIECVLRQLDVIGTKS
ncbi:hypothetical protein PYCC9005_005713 [Savitreella phatthalungensis]